MKKMKKKIGSKVSADLSSRVERSKMNSTDTGIMQHLTSCENVTDFLFS